MPASTLDPVNAALRTALTKNACNDSLDAQLAGSTKKALLANIEFEPAGSYQSCILDKLKGKYIVLKASDSVENRYKCKQQPTNSEEICSEDGLAPAKHELFPLKSVQLGWKNADWFVGTGMVNMGNTCYLNSTLQALFHVPALVNWLISDKQHTSECEDPGGTTCLICAMRKTLLDSQQHSAVAVRPHLIYNKLRVLCRNLLPGRQEDAHEFLRYLVEGMEKSYLSRFKNHSEFDSRTKETTPLNQILGGYLRSAVRCLECGNVSTTFQHFQDILLDIRKAQTIEEALDLYFSREKLDDDSYQCEACKKKVPASKQFALERAPMVLCIQFKRFSISNNKITKHIQFRQRLDLTKYMRRRPIPSLVYKLVALVTHMGPTVNCGHYTAIAQSSSGGYYQFDDSIVKQISHQAVFGTNAYIMLYELEVSPVSQVNGKLKVPAAVTSISLESDDEETPVSTTQVNGMSKVYGPALPPGKFQKADSSSLNRVSFTINGETADATSSTTIISQPQIEDVQNKTVQLLSCTPSSSNSTTAAETSCDIKCPKSLLTSKDQNNIGNMIVTSTTNDSPKPSQCVSELPLVPYEVDELSSSSEESPSSSSNNNITETKTNSVVKVENDWKVTSSTDPVLEPSSQSNILEKKSSTVTELLRLSHTGYAAPVTTWNGTRSHLDKEVSNERREERKRPMIDNTEQRRTKHPKINIPINSNKYNSIQEYHNSKNWHSNSAYQMFYSGKRHRNDRRSFHKSFHKNHHFRH